MKTILIPLAAPMQSWGTGSRWTHRDTGNVPTKSGVVGLVANALGREPEDPIDDLARLRFGVRVDEPGSVLSDYQTVDCGAVVETKEYLMDAKFTAALEGDDTLILDILEAFHHPRGGALFLGRRSCPAAGPITPTVTETGLLDALHTAPSLTGRPVDDMPVEYEPAKGERVEGMPVLANDDPVSFDPRKRDWAARRVVRTTGRHNAYADLIFEEEKLD